jgi:hypothetical protein
MICVGCGCSIPWSGKGMFCYTRPCGAHVFHSEEGIMALPASLVIGLYEKGSLAHIDYYVGNSNYSSLMKTAFIQFLQEKGAIWMKDCKQCQEDGTLERAQESERYCAVQEAERIMRMSENREEERDGG